MPTQMIASGLIAAGMLSSADEVQVPDQAVTEAYRAVAIQNFAIFAAERNDRHARLETHFHWAESILDTDIAPPPAIKVYGACYRFQFHTILDVVLGESRFATQPDSLFAATVTKYMLDVMQSVSNEIGARDYSQLEADLIREAFHDNVLVPSLNFTSARQPNPELCASAEQELRDYVMSDE